MSPNEIIFDQGPLGALARIGLILGLVFGVFVYLMVWGERKISAAIQGRVGPNRVGPAGLLQGLADGLKFLFKEDFRPGKGMTFLYLLAPFASLFPAILVLSVVPLGVRFIDGNWVPLVVSNVHAGVLYILSISSLGVYGVILAGYASNSKYPVLGALRAAAQVISYEIPLGLAILAVVTLAGSFNLAEIVQAQTHSAWFILLSPIGFGIFLVSMFAETNRLPFDLPEGETEIVGFHAEYAGLKFGMFFMAEYANMFTVSCMAVLMFLGGWEFLPFLSWAKIEAMTGISIWQSAYLWILPSLWFILKVAFFLFLFIWVRWTLPRFRYDQLMDLGWKRMIPIALINLLVTVAVAYGLGGL